MSVSHVRSLGQVAGVGAGVACSRYTTLCLVMSNCTASFLCQTLLMFLQAAAARQPGRAYAQLVASGLMADSITEQLAALGISDTGGGGGGGYVSGQRRGALCCCGDYDRRRAKHATL